MSGDWESDLRKLTREAPSENIKRLVLDAMHSDIPDRSAALTMAVGAEIGLQGMLVYALSLRDPKKILKLFYGNGLFSSFDSKISAALNLNVIGTLAYENLCVIKNVRNVFAHALSEVSFDSEPISKACKRIKLLDKNSQFFVDNEEAKKYRLVFGYSCNEIFQKSLNHFSVKWLTGEYDKRSLIDAPILP